MDKLPRGSLVSKDMGSLGHIDLEVSSWNLQVSLIRKPLMSLGSKSWGGYGASGIWEQSFNSRLSGEKKTAGE